MHRHYTFAIIGLGPRGHFALECLTRELDEMNLLHRVNILVFETSSYAGYGPVYAEDQSDSNWINITERLLNLPPRDPLESNTCTIPAFPGYLEWADLLYDDWPSDRVDTFPPRAKLGNYLRDRFVSLINPLREGGVVSEVRDNVVRIGRAEDELTITTRDGVQYEADNILLTIGHQPTEPDDQLSRWQTEAPNHSDIALLSDPYPVDQALDAIESLNAARVAIRGYGLATIDVIRAIANRFGEFSIREKQNVAQSFAISDPLCPEIVPFSLDGLTLGPKPLTPRIDAQFAPGASDLTALRRDLENRKLQAAARGKEFVVDRICYLAAKVFCELEFRRGGKQVNADEVARVSKTWIDDPTLEHPLIHTPKVGPRETLEEFIGMAIGERPISLDYCIGQVWRHCQPAMYDTLSYSAVADEVMADIIFSDEQLKRYTYGPPVESLQQLIALHEVGVLNLDYLVDPEIDVSDKGWQLTNDDQTVRAPIMINAVLDPPRASAVTSSIMGSLFGANSTDTVHDKLGVTTFEDAYLDNRNGADELPIALLGRLAQGTVIGVDAILECFGKRAEGWSQAAVAKAQQHIAAIDE